MKDKLKKALIHRISLKCHLSGIFWLFSILINAQSITDLGCWNTIGLKWTINEKVSFLGDSHFRSSGFYRQFYHIDAKLSVFYSLNDWITFSAGTGRYKVFTKGGDFLKPLENKETRLWEEIILEQSLSRFIFENRNRLEQRFTSSGYKNRLRMRFGLTIPVTRATLIPNTLYIYTYDDIFYVKNIEVNRIFGGIGYETEFGKFQAGWLHQAKYTSGITEYLNVLLVTMIIEIKNRNI